MSKQLFTSTMVMKSFYQSMTGKLSKYKEMLFEIQLKPTKPIFLTSEFLLVTRGIIKTYKK